MNGTASGRVCAYVPPITGLKAHYKKSPVSAGLDYFLYICNMKEIWKNIDGFEGRYQVSNFGNIKSLERKVPFGKQTRTIKEHFLTPHIKGKCRYYQVNLSTNSKPKWTLIHRIVAKAFPEICGDWFEGCEVNHKDENIFNNKASNLEICDRLYNVMFGTLQERHSKQLINNPKISKQISQFDKEGNLIASYPSIAEASRQTGVKKSNISLCSIRERLTAGGYIWRSN